MLIDPLSLVSTAALTALATRIFDHGAAKRILDGASKKLLEEPSLIPKDTPIQILFWDDKTPLRDPWRTCGPLIEATQWTRIISVDFVVPVSSAKFTIPFLNGGRFTTQEIKWNQDQRAITTYDCDLNPAPQGFSRWVLGNGCVVGSAVGGINAMAWNAISNHNWLSSGPLTAALLAGMVTSITDREYNSLFLSVTAGFFSQIMLLAATSETALPVYAIPLLFAAFLFISHLFSKQPQ